MRNRRIRFTPDDFGCQPVVRHPINELLGFPCVHHDLQRVSDVTKGGDRTYMPASIGDITMEVVELKVYKVHDIAELGVVIGAPRVKVSTRLLSRPGARSNRDLP